MKSKRVKRTYSVESLRNDLKTMYNNKYYNLYIRSMKWKGLDAEQEDYLMKKFWSMGTIAAFKIKNTDEIAFADYAANGYNIYDFPSDVNLINKHNVPFIPFNSQKVDEDVVLGWAQSNHKPIRDIVDKYIDRIVEVEMVINTNLQVHKMPFMLGVSEADVDKINDILTKILNDEVAVFSDIEDLNAVKSFVFNSPYVIDKLYSYKTSLESELMTFLGLDNVMSDDTKDRLLVDQANANNEVINVNMENLLAGLQDFAEKIRTVLGYEVSVEPRHKPAESIHEAPTTKEHENGGADHDVE